MVSGNWNPDVVKARPRCRLCARVVLLSDMVRIDGVKPAHKTCADARLLAYTIGSEIHPPSGQLGSEN